MEERGVFLGLCLCLLGVWVLSEYVGSVSVRVGGVCLCVYIAVIRTLPLSTPLSAPTPT